MSAQPVAKLMQHRTIRGRIQYTSKKPGRVGEERGRETFIMTKHSDGKTTIRAHCEIDEPGPTVLRDVIYSVDANNRPMDCHLRLTIADEFLASAWFRMGEDFIEAESYGPKTGRITQRVDIQGPWNGFGSHPIVVDGFNSSMTDTTKGSQKVKSRSFLPSLDHRGASAPLIAEGGLYRSFVGQETITTPAGTFVCNHFRHTDEDGAMMSAHGAHPDYDVWVTADGDRLLVQAGVGGYMQTWYELVELER